MPTGREQYPVLAIVDVMPLRLWPKRQDSNQRGKNSGCRYGVTQMLLRHLMTQLMTQRVLPAKFDAFDDKAKGSASDHNGDRDFCLQRRDVIERGLDHFIAVLAGIA